MGGDEILDCLGLKAKPRVRNLCRCFYNHKELELARKIKEMETADAGDVEQILDIEEALHYYSRLKSPVYVDMYDDFSARPSLRLRRIQHPAALSKCVTGSRRRFRSIRFKGLVAVR